MMEQLLRRTRVRVFGMAVLAAGLLQPGLSQAQNISTVAGNGNYGFSGDGGPATSASLASPYGVAVDAAGNLYIADISNYRIRKVTPAGVISTIAGNGSSGFSGDGGAATSASISDVYKVAMDANGNLYIPDYGNNRIRKVAPSGTISTIAGIGSAGFSGDGGSATGAQLNGPVGIAVDAAGNVFFSDYVNQRIRKVTPTGVISTVAGNGVTGFSGDNGLATNASLRQPLGVGVDAVGRLYIADQGNSRIRRVDASGVISTFAGNGTYGFSGDGGNATAASLATPVDVKADANGNVYIADADNRRIRKVTTGGVISTFAGNGSQGFSGDGGPATSAQLSYAAAIDITAGQMHIADAYNNRIRRISLFASCAAEGYAGAKLKLCSMICEMDQSPSRLTALIKFYVAAFRSEPPCAD